MSASREKKIRQELAAQGVPDIKDIRAAEERKQQRRSNLLYGSVAAIFVLVAAALLVWNSNIIQRSSVAVSVDGVKYSAAEVSYYYNTVMNNTLNSDYASYMTANPSLPMDQQVMEDMDLMFLGYTLPEGVESMTWHEYFVEMAKASLVQQAAVLKAAEKEGFKLSAEDKDEIDQTISTLEEYAKQSGISLSGYLKNVYGGNMTSGVFKTLLTDATLASKFQSNYWDGLTYTDSELEQYYNDNARQFDVANYEYVYFKGSAPSTTDADGKTVAATEAENAAALDKAANAANDVIARYQAGESLEALAKEYEDIATYYSQDAASYSGGVVHDWIFEDGRVEGECEVLTNETSAYYVAVFHGRQRNDYHPVSVRHILRKVNDSSLDATAADYKEKRQVLIDLAKAEAESLLQQWKDGDATAESFGELADANSDDTGSVGYGGLYTNVSKGEMVPVFDEWIYDESRQAGDTDIIFADIENHYTGYHVMYFEGVAEEPHWMLDVRGTMRSIDYAEWQASLVEGLSAEEHSGMKYVG